MIGPPDCMIDIETLGTQPGSAILSIAATRFDALNRGKTSMDFEILINPDDCLVNWNMSYDADTIAWWERQAPEVRTKAFESGPRTTLPKALVQLSAFVSGSTRLWCQGMNFDPPLLEAAYALCSIPRPWQYWQWRDSRTLLSFVDSVPRKGKGAHDALYDVKWQAEMVQYCLRQLGVEKL
jgi:hypothetical protein